MDPKVESKIKGTNRSQKTKTRSSSPPVVPVEVAHMLRISPFLACNLLQTKGHFVKILACNSMIYYIHFSIMNRYMCDLTFLGTHIEASVLFLEPEYDNLGDFLVPLLNLGQNPSCTFDYVRQLSTLLPA
jgi:hypothetical protein